MEVDTVGVRGAQKRVTARDVLCVRYVVDALQARDARVLGHRVDEQTYRILRVDVEVAHHEVGEVVVRMRYALRRGIALELRILIVEVRSHSRTVLRVAYARADAVRGVDARIGVRERRVGLDSRDVVRRVVGYVCLVVAVLTAV